jgi:hypothetical protein
LRSYSISSLFVGANQNNSFAFYDYYAEGVIYQARIIIRARGRENLNEEEDKLGGIEILDATDRINKRSRN